MSDIVISGSVPVAGVSPAIGDATAGEVWATGAGVYELADFDGAADEE